MREGNGTAANGWLTLVSGENAEPYAEIFWVFKPSAEQWVSKASPIGLRYNQGQIHP